MAPSIINPTIKQVPQLTGPSIVNKRKYTLRPWTNDHIRITLQPSGRVLFDGVHNMPQPFDFDVPDGQTLQLTVVD